MDGKTTLGSARALFFNCKNQADNTFWYARGRVGKDFRSRHTMLMTHIWMVHKRLLSEDMGTQGRKIQECMFDELWEDTSSRIRGVGIGELSVNKYLKEVQGYSFKYVIELDQALTHMKGADALTPAAADEKLLLTKDDIGGALWRNAYMRRDEIEVDHVLEMAEYVYTEHQSLMRVPKDAVLEGRIRWGALPAWKKERRPKLGGSSSSGSSSGSSSSSSSVSGAAGDHAASDDADDAVVPASPAGEGGDKVVDASGGGDKGEWKEAVSGSGKVYYWHTRTRETSWVKPK
jgi:cytochrome b pre-mRNA-processing protein 3